METSMNSATSERQKTLTFSCSSCGGRPVWDPSLRKLKCPFCGSVDEIEIDQTPPEVYDLHTAPSEQAMEWGEQTQVVRCEGCGALTVLGQGESASVCPFCGSPRILEDQSSAGIAPESILPFEVTKEAAVSSFRGWLKKKLFAPGKAKRMAALGQITGVYLPHWAYDSDTISHYIGEAGYHYQVEVQVEVERDGKKVKETRMETRTRWEPTSGVVSHSFREILIPGSTRLPESLLEQVQPYQLKELCRYHPGFVAGFMAEKPEVDVQEGWKSAQRKIENEMESRARSDILSRADEARVNSTSHTHSHVGYKLSLLPMYLSSFTYQDKTYHVLINGQSGKCSGQSPVSAGRVVLAVALVAALIFALWYFVFRNGGDAETLELTGQELMQWMNFV